MTHTSVSDSLPRPTSGNMALRQLLVLAGGIGTTAAVLYCVYWLQLKGDTNVMGWYANYIIPVGALLVGAAAGCGYGLTSWLSGVRVRKRVLLTLSVLQIMAYFVSQYIEYASYGQLVHQDTGQAVTFFDFFHQVTVSFAWKDKHGSGTTPLGMWGYGTRTLEVLGFVFGGLFVPFFLMSTPYCDHCLIYMKTLQVAVFPASVPVRNIKKKDVETQASHDKEQAEAYARGREVSEVALNAVNENNMQVFVETIASARAMAKATGKLPARIELALINCKCCNGGYIKLSSAVKNGDAFVSTEVSRTQLPPEKVVQVRDIALRR